MPAVPHHLERGVGVPARPASDPGPDVRPNSVLSMRDALQPSGQPRLRFDSIRDHMLGHLERL
jgi:hypothetical protein